MGNLIKLGHLWTILILKFKLIIKYYILSSKTVLRLLLLKIAYIWLILKRSNKVLKLILNDTRLEKKKKWKNVKKKVLVYFSKIRIKKKKKKNVRLIQRYLKLKKQKQPYLLILRLKRKNIFLTFLQKNGNVVFKTNSGSHGFQKKVKFTGFALQKIGKKVAIKIKGFVVKKVKIQRKAWWQKISNLRKKLKFCYKLKKRVKTFLWQNNKLKNHILQFNIYRRYTIFKKKKYNWKFLKKNKLIHLRLKSNLKFWPMRFILRGLGRTPLRFSKIENRVPKAHSKGFRVKKKRRV